jgi:hypothetical protein
MGICQRSLHFPLLRKKNVGVKYPDYHRPPITTQNPGYNWFSLAANGWGTIHPVSDKASLHQAEEEGPPT